MCIVTDHAGIGWQFMGCINVTFRNKKTEISTLREDSGSLMIISAIVAAELLNDAFGLHFASV